MKSMSPLAAGFNRQAQLRCAREMGRFVEQAAQSGTAAHEVEQALFCKMMEMGRVIFRLFLRLHGDGDEGERVRLPDGTAALVLMRQSEADKRGLYPLARLLGHATFAQSPEWFTTAPGDAIDELQRWLDWSTAEVDLYEINEAFAVVTMAAMRELQLPHDKVNVTGGACALGHPIGASGGCIVVTLIHALRQRGLRRGIASLCLGGGEATAVAVEVM